MRILAIGDIHGCSRAFDVLLAQVSPQPEDLVITLGDYVDRGPDSFGVMERLLKFKEKGRLVALRGNHDEMMLDARAGKEWRMWLVCGGKETLSSYGLAVPEARDLSVVPERHWKFLEEDCVDWYETEKHIFVHASVDPTLPLDKQSIYMLHWEKLINPVAHCSGKVMVCGHTRQVSGDPLDLRTTVCIDTGVYERFGWLTCLDVLTGSYWQANQRGQIRKGQLARPE
jgi:serine/threonine protein phosphatase 1